MSALRYGYVTNGLTGHRLDDALELLAAEGYAGVAITLDHVHLDPFDPDLRAKLAALRERLGELGLAVVIETGGRFVLDPLRKHYPNLLSEGRERRLDLLRRAVGIAAELGAPVVSMWSGALPADVEPELAWERLREGCAALLADAEEHGVTLGFEPEPGMLVESIADYERLAGELGDPPRLGITLDLGHCVCLEPEPVADCVRRARERLVHVHADDMPRGVHEHLPFGEGELDIGAALGALREIGYEGLVAVELSRHAHEAHRLVGESIEILREHELSTTGKEEK